MKKILLLLLAIPLTQAVFAADIAQDVRMGGGAPDTGDGGYFEVGIQFPRYDSSRVDKEGKSRGNTETIAVTIAGEYRYKGFFIEAAHSSSDGLNLGYNFWNNDFWTVDFLAVSGSLIIGNLEDDITGLDELERNKKLTERNRPYQGTGIRATGYFDDYIFQFRLVTDTANGNGISSTARIGKSWQVKNWNFHSILSMRYASAETNQFFYGVTANEATVIFPEFRPESTINFSAELGVTYPVSEHWVFRSTARFFDFSSDSQESPLRDDSNGFVVSASLSYVF